jgi:hypothetical protein
MMISGAGFECWVVDCGQQPPIRATTRETCCRVFDRRSKRSTDDPARIGCAGAMLVLEHIAGRAR